MHADEILYCGCQFNFHSYRSNLSPALGKTQIKVCPFSSKWLTHKRQAQNLKQTLLKSTTFILSVFQYCEYYENTKEKFLNVY